MFNKNFLSWCFSYIYNIYDNTINVVKIIICLPWIAVTFLVLSMRHTYCLDPPCIKNKKTPILLIHGSHSNQHQWIYFRYFLKSKDIGHIFTVNLNRMSWCNDRNRDVVDYSRTVHSKLLEMKQMYKNHNINMDSVILIGNSMGGLVGGAYCISNILDKVQVNALITISSPWKGSYIANIFCCKNKYPEKYFRKDSVERSLLVQKVMNFYETNKKNGFEIYNYGSTFDMMVPIYSCQLNLPKENILVDNRNDHLTTMVDKKLTTFIREFWIQKHTQLL